MTHGCQAWSLNKLLVIKLRTAERAMKREMLNSRLQDKMPCSFFFFCVRCDGCVDSIISPVSPAYLDVRNKSSADPQSLVLTDTQVGHICCLALTCWWSKQDCSGVWSVSPQGHWAEVFTPILLRWLCSLQWPVLSERWWSVGVVAADGVHPGLGCILQSCSRRWHSFYYG